MPAAPNPLRSRQQTIMGQAKVIDEARDLNLRGVALGEQPAVGRINHDTPIKSEPEFMRRQRAAATATPRQVKEQIAAQVAAAPPPPPADDDEKFVFADEAPYCPGHPGKCGPSIYAGPISKLSKARPFLFIADEERAQSKNGMASYLKKIANRLRIKVTVRTKFEYRGRIGFGIWYLGVLPEKD